MIARVMKLGLGLVASLALAATAVAYLATTGSGSAAGGVDRELQALTITGATPSSQLYPGGSAAVVAVVSNPNQDVVRLPSVQLDSSEGTGGFSVDGDHAGCDVAALEFSPVTGGRDVPAGGTLVVDLPGALSMDAHAANACQGAKFTVHLKAGA